VGQPDHETGAVTRVEPAAPADDAGGAITGETVLEMFRKGGLLMWPILLCSVGVLAFTLERAVSLRASAVFPAKLLEQVRALVRDGKTDEAAGVCEQSRSEFGSLLHACLLRADSAGFEMEAALEEAGSRALYDLRRNCRPLGVIADVAPLLGLMGTVVGMIKAFEVVAKTGALGRAEMLAEGIAEALLTTAFGLCVAVPSLILYHFFRGKADGLVRAMEDACIDVLVDLRKRKKA
jgi:biopolymer transport protein ExbB